MTDFEKTLIKRDELSEEDARIAKREARKILYNILENGGSYDEVEDMLAGDYGLEMDYIFDLL